MFSYMYSYHNLQDSYYLVDHLHNYVFVTISILQMSELICNGQVDEK